MTNAAVSTAVPFDGTEDGGKNAGDDARELVLDYAGEICPAL